MRLQLEESNKMLADDASQLKERVQTLLAGSLFAQERLTASVDLIRRLQEELLEQEVRYQALRDLLSTEVSKRQKATGKLAWNRQRLSIESSTLADKDVQILEISHILATTLQKMTAMRILLSRSVRANSD
jgi:hypothetical protein